MESLYDIISELKKIEVGIKHPEHLKVGAYITKVRTDRACVDYEVDKKNQLFQKRNS